jgi:hypothetical protein
MTGLVPLSTSYRNFAESWKRSTSSNSPRSRQEESVIVRPVHFVILAILLCLVAVHTPAQATAGPAPAPTSTSSSGSSAPAAPQSQSSFQGSVPGKLEPGVVQISMHDAIDRGLKTNLGLLLSEQDIGSARG